ncbi:MAG TPA: BREX system ATP-binding domain-containing protein [Kofleriaceae bacterium]|nr:BREX system ATP-binding domain-containing protein [Kofleriaceae bacterium]
MIRPPKLPTDPDRKLARRILAQMGENGKPPELGISHVNVGNESYLQVIDAAYVGDLIGVVEGSSFKIVQGTYGAGKTHFLYCVRDLAWRRGLLAAFVTISPKECPFNRPLAIYKAIANSIELPRGTGGEITRGVDDVIRANLEARIAEEGRDATRAWLDKQLARAQITRHSFRDAVVGFSRAVLDNDEPTARLLGAWLRGEDVSVSEVKAAGVFELPSNENGFGMVRSLVQLVHQLGYEGTVVLLDEAERRLSVDGKPTKTMAETMDHLRELVDLCGRSELPRTLVLYAVTPAFTADVLPQYPALQQRLGAPIQFLSTTNPKAPVIDLEALDLEPRKLLVELGRRLVVVAKRAYEWSPNDKLVERNLDLLASIVAEEQLEVGHRRFFVKLCIRLLDQQRIGGEKKLDDDHIQALVRDEQALQLEEARPDEYGEFLGITFRKKKD